VHLIELASQFNLAATYDAHYLALAERENCEFWTADERLYNSVRDRFSWVRLMADPLSASMAS
jgi:predicted nucleic acid-binding protein